MSGGLSESCALTPTLSQRERGLVRSLDGTKWNPWLVVAGEDRVIPGLQNTSMYSALRASHGLFKFDPIEFSSFHFIQATRVVFPRHSYLVFK